MANTNEKFIQELRNQARSKVDGENFQMTPEVSISIYRSPFLIKTVEKYQQFYCLRILLESSILIPKLLFIYNLYIVSFSRKLIVLKK